MKKAGTLFLSFLMVCSLAACGKQEQASENKTPESLAESVEDKESTDLSVFDSLDSREEITFSLAQ